MIFFSVSHRRFKSDSDTAIDQSIAISTNSSRTSSDAASASASDCTTTAIASSSDSNSSATRVPQSTDTDTRKYYDSRVLIAKNYFIPLQAVGVHQVQQQQVHVAASSCQSVPLQNIVQVPSDGSCLGQQVTMGQIHDQSDRLFQNYPIQAVTNVLSGVVPQGHAYYIVVNNSNMKKDGMNSDNEILGGP
jgi:hypothetical protein